MRRFWIIPVICLLLTGCFGTRPKIYIIEEDNIPSQVVQEEPVRVRVIDPTTKEEAEMDKKVTGYFVLSPSLYRKLVKTGLSTMPEKDNK